MENFLLGDYIRQRRLDLGLTQEEVCCGICSPVTFSRLENNRQNPGRTRINAILQRLNLPDDRYYTLMSHREQELEELKRQIIACNAPDPLDTEIRVEEGFARIAQLEQLAAPEDQMTQQFLLRAKALLGRLDQRYTPQQLQEMLLRAIRLTVPRFDLDQLEQFLYTSDELKIINQIASACSSAGDNQMAHHIYSQMLRYLRSHFREVVNSPEVLVMFLFNSARALDLCGRYQEGKALAMEGRDACCQYAFYPPLPNCLAIAAECCYFLGQKTESADLYRQVYYLYKALEQPAHQEAIRKEAREYLALNLD